MTGHFYFGSLSPPLFNIRPFFCSLQPSTWPHRQIIISITSIIQYKTILLQSTTLNLASPPNNYLFDFMRKPLSSTSACSLHALYWSFRSFFPPVKNLWLSCSMQPMSCFWCDWPPSTWTGIPPLLRYVWYFHALHPLALLWQIFFSPGPSTLNSALWQLILWETLQKCLYKIRQCIHHWIIEAT